MFAQNVTISPSSGSLVAAYTSGSEIGGKAGWSSLWRHEQLPLSLTVSDESTLTDAGELKNPAGNLYNKNGRLVVLGGIPYNGYMVLSLPKGYRITGYKIVLLNDNVNVEFPAYGTIGQETKSFYETDANFDYTNYKARAQAQNGTWQMSRNNEGNTEYIIERNSVTEDDMTNQLYFIMRLHDHNNFSVLTIKSFEVWFTAEGTFEAEVKPEKMEQARSVVTSPFQTSKMDIGAMTRKQGTNGNYYYTYDYNNVRDLTGYNYIYQSNAVQDGIPTEGSEAKTIYPVHVDGKDLFAFGNNIYYAETPIQVHTQSGLDAPVGYRIVGARFNYLWGTVTSATTIDEGYYITYISGGTTYYLNNQLHFTTNPYAWNIDNYGNIYYGSGNNRRYLACNGSGGTRTLSTSSNATGYNASWNLNIENGYLHFESWNYGDLYLVGTTDASATPTLSNNSQESQRAQWTELTEPINIPGFTPGTYTLSVYDKTGANPQTVNVTQSNAGGILELDGLNNDAVKFQITNLDDGKQALVAITLLLEALDPYIDKMDIVCHDPDNQLELAQSFTANDFSVSGGAFKFYIPKDYENTELTFTFRDLYSKYGDNTYYTGTADQKDGNARYSFVTSSYFMPINGNGNGGLYDSAYDPNASYTSKILTSTAGNIRFKFNNAEDLNVTGGQTDESYLEETPFSVTAYLASTDPDGIISGNGQFIDCKLIANPTATTKNKDVFYVFTADETRYNIAPTTAWQHRSYAFYRMDIELVAKTYTPDLTWTKVYDETFYTDDNNATQNKSMWGLKLATTDNGQKVTGYLTVKEILDAIDERTADDTETGGPKDLDQILYVDGNELYSIINSADKHLSDLKTSLGTNALVFLPANTTSTLDNFAYKTASGSFRAGKDIVITDKRPFFSPYDIQVDPANWAKYDRQITYTGYNPIKHATIVLPFTIDVDKKSYKHHNEDNDGVDFTLATMNSSGNSLAKKDGSNYDYFADAYFTTLTSTSQANIPYIVTLESADEDAFKAHCKGSLVKATTDNGVFEGETASGEFEGTPYTFTNTGTYTGKEVGDETEGGAAAAEEKVFYFGNNYFLDSKTLKAPKSVKILPFRSFYEYKATAGAKMSRFYIAFGENPNMGDTNGITDVQRDADLAVIPGKGIITLIARAEKDVTIHAVSGITVDKCSLNAGETRTVAVPAGVYVINGVKMVVK